ncbi:interleukin-31 receptor subunit alpha isoform X2 [Pangasianodon hypophthalmus]|uniref:interleukin-31 receptor subunit alpha isoform X2 n=1 Tax=Pangasianodon hypophthalmus TaxID=310915 RepID=UPI002307F2CF|nr:interleukin-31 receptor subunit alpha isoform X2 [Pangasianodon hypophthalmus]
MLGHNKLLSVHRMICRSTFCILFCIFSLCHYGVPLKWHGKELSRSNNYTEELSVSGKDLKRCENHRNVCVVDTKVCASIPSHGQDRFLNTSCRYHVLQRSFACKWIYLNNVKATGNSFIFSQREDFKHCPTIFTPLAAFNMNIISKDIVNKVELISEAYTVSITAITQAPCPVITSVNATVTSLNVTWNKGHRHSTKCQIRYKCSTTEQWTVDSLTISEMDKLEISHVIDGLQPFSQYTLTVACSGDYGLWSDWSEEFQAMTLEAVPTAPPYVSFYVENSGKRSKPQKLILIWRELEIKEARGVILGYNVTYTPTMQPGLKRTIHTKDQKAILEVTADDYDLTVIAYNTAGQSPSTNLRVNAGVFQSLPKVKGLWASSEAVSLRIRWETSAVNVSEFAIEWFSIGGDFSKQWKRLNGSTFSTILTGHIEPLKKYSISVYSLYGTLCAPPETIQASLEYGTLLDIIQLQPVNVTKTSMTVQWVWKEQSSTTNVLQYRLVLSGAHETSSLVVFPHQWQHSFHNLQTNAKYTVSIYGETTSGNFLKANTEFTTLRLESDEIIQAAVPIVLLIVVFGIFSVLSRTVYKDYFFPNIANPGHSLIGHWLLNPPYEREAAVNVLKLEDFSVTNQLNEKSRIHIEPQMSLDREGFDEDMALSKMSLPDNYPIENSDNLENSMTSPGFTEYVDLPLFHANFDYVENCEIQLC